jgi:hypothetical protein
MPTYFDDGVREVIMLLDAVYLRPAPAEDEFDCGRTYNLERSSIRFKALLLVMSLHGFCISAVARHTEDICPTQPETLLHCARLDEGEPLSLAAHQSAVVFPDVVIIVRASF